MCVFILLGSNSNRPELVRMEGVVKRKSVALTISLVLILLGLSANSNAQSNNPCILNFNYWWFTGPIPLGATCYTGPVWFFTPCTVPTCPPPPECLACQPSGDGGHPISLATGNTYIQQKDLSIPGLSGGLSLVRTWNSKWPSTQSTFQVGLFGPNWRSTYEERIFLGLDNLVRYSRGDGDFWALAYNGSTYNVVAPGNASATLAAGSSYWTLTFQNGEQRRFDNTTGNLIAIIDRNGNTTQLAYDSSGRLVTVTDPASRILTFSYGSSSSKLVTGVTASVGPALTYAYDSQGRLIQVTKPDLTTVSFAYNSQSLITSVTDSNGKVLESHTYDSNARGLTSSRAGGVDAVTFTYPQ
jgi:YD repeat-containing protein